MNLNPVQFFDKRFPKRAARVCRLISATLCLFLLTAVPALADVVTANQVVQALSSSQGTIDLRLKSLLAQDPVTTKGGTQSGPRSDTPQGTQSQGGAKSESVISGVAVTSEGQQLGVEIVEEGEVEGTICDCGEIMVAGGAFPKWPFLFLAAVPLVFLDDCDTCEEQNEPTPTPTPPSSPTPTPPSNPTPTPPEVPEPGSLVLLGTGLAAAGAGLRRRYAKMKMAQQKQEEE